MLRVFLSYAHADGQDAANSLREGLTQEGYDVWQDTRNMRAGERWRQQIRDELSSVDTVVVLLTPEAVRSDSVVHWEWESAETLSRTPIPLMIVNCQPPVNWQVLHYHDLTGTKYPTGYAKLRGDLELASVKKDLLQLADDGKSPFFWLLERLQLGAKTGVYKAPLLKSFIDLIGHMRADKGTTTLPELLSRAIAGTYVQPGWSSYAEFQSNLGVSKELLSQFRDQIRSTTMLDRNAIPVVLVTMTASEAEQLDNETAFAGQPKALQDEFKELRALLDTRGQKQWRDWFQANPADWRPFGGAESIAQIVRRALGDVAGGPFVPEFIDIRYLSDDRGLLRKLRIEGCVLIIDTISIRHPLLQRAFYRSLLDAYQKTSVVTIAPVRDDFDLVRKVTIVFQSCTGDLEFAKRKRDPAEEYGACAEIHEELEFEQWLATRARKLKAARERFFQGQ